MSFFKNRLHSLFALTIIATCFWGQSGGVLLAQTTFDITSFADLKTAIETISNSSGAHTFTLNISKTITLTGDLPELNVPSGATVNINDGRIDGNSSFNGLVINTETGSIVNISQTTFNNQGLVINTEAGGTVNISQSTFNNRGLVIDTEAGGAVNILEVTFNNCVSPDGQGDSGLGGAMLVRGDQDCVTLTDVQFTNKSGGIFLDGTNLTFDNNTLLDTTAANNISDISATPGFDKWQKDDLGNYVLVKQAGGITIANGDTVTLTGDNTYAGVTLIKDGATLIANGTALKDSNGKDLKDALGKTIHNAIGDLSEVKIEKNGTLQLNQNETIGFLSSDNDSLSPGYDPSPGTGKVELNGKTLTIAGDEDPDFFGQGINPVTGSPVGAFNGSIITDANGGQLIKTGTGRLTLTNDNSNAVDFTTTIYQGTIVLGDAKALGGGEMTIKNIDTGTGSKLRNVIEANKSLTETTNGAVMNNFRIDKNYNAMVVGGGFDIQFGQAGVQGGQITGGNLLVNMNNASTQVILANEGFDTASGDKIASLLNSYNETQIKKGTVVVNQYTLTDGTKGSTLGTGSVRAMGLYGEAILSAGTVDLTPGGMIISNNLAMDYGSALTLANEGSLNYTITGNTSGRGGLIVDLTNATDEVTLTGAISHTGATRIDKGILVIDPASPRNSTTLYDLSATIDGALDVKGGDLYVSISKSKEIFYSGKIDMNTGGVNPNSRLIKTGEGTWVFDTAGITSAIEVNQGALKLDVNNTVPIVDLNNSGQLIIDNDVTLASLTSKDQWSTNVTINGSNALTLNTLAGGTLMNTWTGGLGAEVQFNNDTTLQNTYQNPSNWQGTMIVGDGTDGAILTVKSHGGLGDPDEAKVTLNTDSTLVIDTYRPGDRYSYPEQIGQLNVDGDSTVEVKGGNNFITKELTGTAPDTVTKKGVGLWTMLGPSPSFDGTVELAEGGIYLSGTPGSYDSNWGVGTLNVTGDSSLYVDTNSNGRLVAGEIDIDADKVLTIGLVQKDTTYGEVTMTNMTGPGGVNYAGNGTLVYGSGGTIDYTGDTNIFGGTLRVETNTATNYFVKNGGTLQGVGSVTTSGTLTFESGSKLIADYTTGTDPVFAASQVTIHDGAVAHVIATPGSLWDESSAKTLVSGSRTSNDMFWFINNIQGKRTVGEWDGSDNLKIWFIDFDYEDNINTTNANNMVPYLYAIVDNTTPAATTRGGSIPINTLTSDLLKALENTNPSQYNDALLEIGGQINASMVTAQVQTTTGIFQSVTKQLYPAGVYAAQCFNPAAYDDEEGYAVSGGTIYRGQSMRSRWTGWSSGLGGFGNTKDQAGRGTFGYDYNSYGMSFGIEPTTATSANRIGLFYAYTYTEIDTNKTIGSGRINDHFVGGYGRFVDGLGYTSFVAGFGFDKYKTSRSVTMPFGTGGQSRSEFDGWQGGLYVERGLGNVTGFGLQPYAGLQYLYAETDAFAETGTNPYKLETGATSVNSLRSNLGVRIARQICRVQRGNMYVSGSVSWMHEFLDADCVMASKWGVSNNPSTFGVRGNSLGRDWAVIGAGMEWQLRERLSIFGSYDLQINSYQALNIGNIGARIQW